MKLIFYVILAAVCIGITAFLHRFAMIRMDPLKANSIFAVWIKNLVIFLIFSILLFMVGGPKINFHGDGWIGPLALICSGVLTAIAAYLTFRVYSLGMELQIASSLKTAIPLIITLILAVIFLGERMTLIRLFGILLILSGTFFVLR